VLLLVSIAVRSLVGLTAARGYQRSDWLVVGIPVAGFLGKSLGGVVADRFGWIRTTVTVLLVSAPLVAVPWSHPVILLAGLLAFQMTMPVTLVTVARLMPNRLGTAFGWTCFALALGSLPAMFDWGGVLSARPMLFGWILVAAVAVFAGLTLAEVGDRDRDRGPGGGLATRTITGTGRDGVDECPAPQPSR